MVTTPLCRGGRARSVAAGHILRLGCDNMAGDLAAATLRLSPAQGVTGTASGDNSSPALSPPGGVGDDTRPKGWGQLSTERAVKGWRMAAGLTPLPLLPLAAVDIFQFALLDFGCFYTWQEAVVTSVVDFRAGVKGATAKAPPPPPQSLSTDGSTTASRRCGGGTDKPPVFSPTPASDGHGPLPPVSLAPSRGLEPGCYACGVYPLRTARNGPFEW